MDSKLYGKCILSIKLDNHGEYLKWKTYVGAPNWEPVTPYPVIMRQEYVFHTVDDVYNLTRQIVMLLQMGFNVHSANWQLKDYKSQLT